MLVQHPELQFGYVISTDKLRHTYSGENPLSISISVAIACYKEGQDIVWVFTVPTVVEETALAKALSSYILSLLLAV